MISLFLFGILYRFSAPPLQKRKRAVSCFTQDYFQNLTKPIKKVQSLKRKDFTLFL